MQMCRNLMYLHLLLWILRESNGQSGFCYERQPDVRLCTDDAVTTKREVFIDTVDVSAFQQTSCECIITPFGIDAEFDFAVVYGQTAFKNMQFKVNDLVLDKGVYNGITHLTGETKLYFSAFGKFRKGGSCLRVLKEDGSNFNLTCTRSQEHTTTPSIITTSAKSTSTRLFSTHIDKVEVIIPVTILSIVCLVLLAAVILLCSRRNRQQRQVFDNSKPVVEQEAVDNCYRHDNPMYNATETQTNVEPSEYHYIQHGEHDARLSTGHYESVPDSPFSKQLPANLANCSQHYDYTTCVKTSKEKGNITETETANTADTRNGAELPRDMVASDNVYDRTDKSAAKQFFNLSSSKMCHANTYDTAGNVSVKEGKNEGSVYDVAIFH